MTDAPERIHVRWGKAGDTRVAYMEERFLPPDNAADYVRADIHAALQDRVARLEAALQFYANPLLHKSRAWMEKSDAEADCGKTARSALTEAAP